MALGKLLSPFAIKGGIKVKSFSGENSHFKKLIGCPVFLVKDDEHREIKVNDVIIKGDTAVFFFMGYDSPEAVKLLGGFELWAERCYGLPLYLDEFYMRDLIGCSLFFKGDRVGTIIAYIEASTLMLEAKKDDDSIFFIPFIKHFIGDIDLAEQSIQLLNDESM